jgi:hypothetical protein
MSSPQGDTFSVLTAVHRLHGFFATAWHRRLQKLKINEAPVRVNRTQLDLDSIADVNTLNRAD